MRTYKRKTQWFNTTGYTDGSNTSMNNSNTIPSNQITMNNTSQPLKAQGIDELGFPTTNEVVLEPGQNYNFNNAFAVVETPVFQPGGIFGYQRVRVGNRLFDPVYGRFVDSNATPQTNTLNSQPPTYFNTGYNTTFGTVPSNPFSTEPQYSFRPPEYSYNTTTPNIPTVQVNETQTVTTPEVIPSVSSSTTTPVTQESQVSASIVNDNGLNDWNRAYLTGQGQPQGYSDNYNVPAPTTEDISIMSSNNTQNTNNNNQRFQFYNPYVGMDLAGASYMFGNSLQSGDTTGAVFSGLKLATGLGRNLLSGIGMARRNQQIASDYAQQQRDAMTQANRPQYLQEGGEIPQQDPVQMVAEVLSQGVSPDEVFQMLLQEGLSEQEAQMLIEEASQIFQDGGVYQEFAGRIQEETQGEYNAELENNEWILDSQGLRQVKGKDHEDGGVKLNLEEGTLILSDFLKVGDKNLIKNLNKEYDVKISPKDTYAKALEKIYNKTGLNPLMDKHAKLIEKTEKQADIKDENTLNVNVEVLTKQMHEIELEKQPLEEKAIEAFNTLFQAQEREKETQGESEKFQDGGIAQRLRVQAPNYTDLERNMIIGRYQAHQTPETVQQLQNLLDSGRLIYNRGTLDRLQSGENLGLATQLQHRDTAGTYGEMDDLRRSGYVYNDTYRNLYGSDLNYGDASVMNEWNPRIRQGLSDLGINYRTAIQGNQENAFGTITSEQPGIVAELPGTLEGNFDTNAYRSLSDTEKEEFAKEVGVDKSQLDGLVNNPAIVQFRTTPQSQPTETVSTGTDTPTNNATNTSNQTESNQDNTPSQRRTGLLPVADTTLLPPPAQQAHLKTNRRFERASFVGVSPEQQLTELNRLTSRVVSNLDNLSPNQRASVEANMLATQAQQANQILNQTQQYNNQEFNRIQNVNNQIQMSEENAAAQDALNYEQRQFLAQAKTDADVRNYYNALQRQQQVNFDAVRDANKLNYMYPDFQLTDQGYEAVGNPSFTFNGQTLTQDQIKLINKTLEKDTKKNKKKFGGRFGKTK